MHLPNRNEFKQKIDAARRNYPDIAKAAAGQALSTTIAGDASAANVVDAALNQAHIEQKLDADDPALVSIVDVVTRQVFETIHRESVELFNRIGLAVPPFSSFQARGVDFARLASRYEEMEDRGHEPMLVISPSLPLVGDGDSNELSWESLYKQLADDQAIPNNPLGKGATGLLIAKGVRDNSQPLFEQERIRILRHDIAENSIEVWRENGGDIVWTVAIVPGIDGSRALEEEYHKSRGRHIFVSQYLTTQAIRIQQGRTPMDAAHDREITWLHEEIGRRRSDGSLKSSPLVGSWDAGLGQISIEINMSEGGPQNIYGHARVPSW